MFKAYVGITATGSILFLAGCIAGSPLAGVALSTAYTSFMFKDMKKHQS